MRLIIPSLHSRGNVDNYKNIAFANHVNVPKWNAFVA